jgi:hypothetical protein
MILMNGAVVHAPWCEYEGDIVSVFMPLTAEVVFRCPTCWGGPCDDESLVVTVTS